MLPRNRAVGLPRRNGDVQTVNSKETRGDVKHGIIYMSEFSGSAE